jgi:hypothetical protein
MSEIRAITSFVAAVLLSALAALVAVVALAAVVSNLLYSLRNGYFSGGKEGVLVLLLPIVAFLLLRWAREAWIRWMRLRREG